MERLVFLVLGLAAFSIQDESLTTKNLKKLDRFPAIQSFVKHLYAHEIQGLPHGGGGKDNEHDHGHGHGLETGSQTEKPSSYMNIQNVNLIVKNNRGTPPLDHIAKLKPILQNIELTPEKAENVARCGDDGRCDDDNDDRENKNKNNRNEAMESLSKVLSNIKQHTGKVKPVLPYWAELKGGSLNYNNQYDDEQEYDLRCGCNRMSQREGMNGEGLYNLRCGCQKRERNSRDRLEDNGMYDLRCGCNQYSQREGLGSSGQYDLRCGCSKSSQREGMESNGQYDLRCGCSRPSEREGAESNGQYDLTCGCSRSLPREGLENNGQYNLRCGCSRTSQREGNSNGQYDLRCGCRSQDRNLIEIQSPRLENNNGMTIDVDDLYGDDTKNIVISGKDRIVNEIDEVPPMTYPDAVYMGLDPNDEYFGKVNRAMKTNVNPQEFFSFYNDWKSRITDNLLAYVLRDRDDVDLSHLSRMQHRIIRNLRNTIPKLKNVDTRKLRNRLASLIFGVESESSVLPHDEASLNIYVPRWAHNHLRSYSSDRKDNLRHPKSRLSLFPLTKKQKLRLQRIIKKQISANANAQPTYWRRSEKQDADYGVPFEMDVQGLGQVNL